MSTLLQKIRNGPCLSCGNPGRCDVSHIKSRGSGGTNDPWNIVPMCRKCHTLWHYYGPYRFCQQYRFFHRALLSLGWYWDGYKLRHDKYNNSRSPKDDQPNDGQVVEVDFRRKKKVGKVDPSGDNGPEAS